MRKHLGWLALSLAGLLAVAGATQAMAQSYPSRPITLLVPAAAGGPTDAMARMVAESMGRTLNTQVVVENVGGAAGTIGMARVAKAAPDGYTVSVWHIAQATAPTLYDNLRYNVINDFDSIGRIADAPMTIVGKAKLEPKNASELIAWIKQKKSAVTYAHAGIGSASHLCSLMFMSAIDAQMTAVSYRGTGPAMTDLLGGQFDVMCDQTTTTAAQIREGKIKGYAATTRQRLAVLPDLPTLDEAGLKGFEVAAWHAMWAPRGLPAEVSKRLTERAAGGAEGPEGDGTPGRARRHPGAAATADAGGAGVASQGRGRQMVAGDQGVGREGDLTGKRDERRALPRVFDGAGAGEVCAPLANSPSNLPISVTPLVRRTSATADVSAASRGAAAPSTVKLAAGSVWNALWMRLPGLKSCTQAARPRSTSCDPLANACRVSSQKPSSLRVSVVVCEV